MRRPHLERPEGLISFYRGFDVPLFPEGAEVRMSSDAIDDAYEKGRNLSFGIQPQATTKRTRRERVSRWREDWSRERALRDKGFTCSKCRYFASEKDHPLARTFPDLGMCSKFGSHRFGSASCSMGQWEGRRRPDHVSE